MSLQKLEDALDLRKMHGKEGLVFQGCGGDLQKWVDGVNNLLTETGILKNGAHFENVTEFQVSDHTCLLFPFEDVGENLDVGQLAVWRLRTYDTFGAMWLSDFVENKLGGFDTQKHQKPLSPIIGAAKEMQSRVTASGSYSEALSIISEYVEPVDAAEWEPDEDMKLEGY